MTVVAVAGGALWIAWLAGTLYLLGLAIAAACHGQRDRQPADRNRSLCIVVPAHDEELLLGDVLDGLGGLDYPAERYVVVVVADNCSDRTADVAAAHGADVLERIDPDLRGKGYALEWALGRLIADPRAFDAFVILDADSILSADFLAVMNAALAAGHDVIQGRYDVLNVREGWRTRLMACALALAHYVKPLGRRKLGLSDGLKGNGMCFSRKVIEAVPWSGESITEDIDHTLRLVEAGYRIEFAPDAVVRAQMPTGGRQAATQRQRWEGGRYALLRRGLGLLATALRRRHVVMADRAMELLIPPFVELFAVPVVMIVGLAVACAAYRDVAWLPWLAAAWAGIIALQIVYLVLGLALARVPLDVALSLVFAPVYAVWKFGLYGAMLMRRGTGGWRRTERKSF